jgi:hypothetical protein
MYQFKKATVMSRAGYSEDCETLNLWRGAVERAIRGKRGQAFLREMAKALDAMPAKALIAGDIVRDGSNVCAIGAVAVARGMSVERLDIYDGEEVGAAFGVAKALACEIAYENDEGGAGNETIEQRWSRMRAWVAAQLRASVATGEPL